MLRKKLMRTTLALALCAALLGGVAANAAFTIPAHGLLVDEKDTTIKVSAMRAGQVAPMILGANLVATSNLGALQDANTKNPNSLLGVFGSDVNSNPDPYLYNYFFNNAYAAEHGLETIAAATSAVEQLDGTGQSPDVILEALTNRPDLVLSQGGGTGSSDPNESYVNVIASLPENQDEDPDNDYNPSYFTCSISTLVYQTENLKNLAATMKDLMDEKSLTARYGDPTVIAADYDKYIWGLYFYIQKQVGDNKKTVAVVTGTEDNGANWTMPLRATDVAQSKPNRLVEYTRDNTILLSDTLGEKASLEQVLEADVVVAVGKGEVLRTAAEAAGVAEADMPVIFDSLPNCLYGMTMQTHENALGIPYLQSFIYADDLDLNPAYAAAYFYQKFFHVTDDAALQETVEVLLDGADLPAGVTADLTDYDPADIEKMIEEGVAYATENKLSRHDETTPWAPDMTVGIGTRNTTGDAKYVSAANESFTPGPAAETPETPETTAKTFTDVPAAAWYASAVSFVAGEEIMGGTSETTFNPDGEMSRAMLVTALYRMAGSPDSAGMVLGEFSDAADVADWAAPAVRWAVQNGILTGTSATTLSPNAPVTREQIVVMLYKFTESKGITIGTPTAHDNFKGMKDYGSISSWAVDAMNWGYNAHLIQGSDAGLINPQGTASRAEVATMLMRYTTG